MTRIQPFCIGSGETNSYVIYSSENHLAYIVDAPDGNESILSFIKQNNLDLCAVLLTHGHFDHILGLGEIVKAFPKALVYLDKNDFDFVKDGAKKNKAILPSSYISYFSKEFQTLPDEILDYPNKIDQFEIIRTPGHTMGSVCLYDRKEKLLFSGDTLFQGGIGRHDLGGDYSCLIKSLEKLKELDDETIVFPGHGNNTQIGIEKTSNPYL